MRKLTTAFLGLFVVSMLPAQGIYNLWGITSHGGPGDLGVIFKTDNRGNHFTNAHLFNGADDGNYPYGRLTYFNDKLYGTTTSDDGVCKCGRLFELDPTTGSYTVKIEFNDDPNDASGLILYGTLSVYGTKLYGMGGIAGVAGIIEWDPVTNIYVKRVDFPGDWGPGLSASLTFTGGKCYGVTILGGLNNQGVLFAWDPVTNDLEKKLDFTGLAGPYPSPYETSLEAKDGKLYGVGISGGTYGMGVIFEWDPATNTYTKKFDFGGDFDSLGSSPFSGLTLCGNKFYGMTMDGGLYGLGLLYEWDPLTNAYTIRRSFDGAISGKWPHAKLCAFGGRLYGMLGYGGSYDKGLLFETDPATSEFDVKEYFMNIMFVSATGGAFAPNAALPVEGNTLTPAPAAIASVVANRCVDFPPVAIDATNNEAWVAITDSTANAVAEVKANGNNLGVLSVHGYVNNQALRHDHNGRLYLDRSITITPQVQPSTPVDVRFYILGSELEALKQATNSSFGQPSGIDGIGDIAIFKTNDDCSDALRSEAFPIETTAESWANGYVLSASVSSFSSFYFADKTFAVLPINLAGFTGLFVNGNVELRWKSENEMRTSHFEIERSSDGQHFFVIGQVSSFNSPTVHNYLFTDFHTDTVQSIRIYYRLKLVNMDGKFDYSSTVTLNRESRNVISFHPNPVGGKATLMITLRAADHLELQIMDEMGRVVKLQQWALPAGTTSLTLDLGPLPHGSYFLGIRGTVFNDHVVFVK